jgi:hypothetical protein
MHHDQKFALTFAIYDGEKLVRRQTVANDIIKLGSGSQCNIAVDDAGVARMHAVVEVLSGDEITLIDLGHTPGTRLNGACVNKASLKAGDEIQLGERRLVLESVEHALKRRIASAVPYSVADAGKFQSPLLANPFATPALASVFAGEAAADAPEGTYEYRMVKGEGFAPEVDSDADVIEVRILWGRNLLHVAHVKPKQSFFVGETEGNLRCDFFMPAAKLGKSRAPLFVDGQALAPAGATATVTVDGKPAMRIEEAVALGVASPAADGHRVVLASDTTLRIQFDDMIVEMRGVKRARKVASALTFAAVASGALLYVLGSLAGHAGLLAAMAAFAPPLGATGDDQITDDQRYLIQQYLDAAAQRETEAPEEAMLQDAAKDDSEGGQGQAAKGESGKMGTPSAPPANLRWAVEGSNPHPYISRTELLQHAADFGAIGVLAGLEGSKDEPHALWGEARSDGADPVSAAGNMWGNDIGAAWGMGGLGMSGTGEGAGGLGEGIGLGDVGTVGHGSGYGCATCQGFGNGTGRIARGHKAKAPDARQAEGFKLNGRLPPEVIQRVVRQNAGRYKACYQSALRTNPNLQGRVEVRFVIGRDGTVSSASAGGDMPDAGVKSCVAGAFRSLTFPKPDGIVTISYPLMFYPAGG